jgi:hypothetical protein
VEKSRCSNLEMYSSCRLCWIMVLVLSTQAFGEAIIEFSKNHSLLIQYLNNTYFCALEFS